jgi:hypothetical protein
VPGRGKAYSIYGIKVWSSAALPCPPWRGGDDGAQVRLIEAGAREIATASATPPSSVEGDSFWQYQYFADGALRAAWREHFEFFVAGDGSKVLWRRLARVPDEVLFTYLLNQVLSECLAARGVESLHASAVVVQGGAVALLGDSGFGKSTLAAGMMRAGHALLTDDVLVLEFKGSRVLAQPSLARLKLHPDGTEAFFGARASLPMNTFTDKKILRLQRAEHAARRVPLRALFVLPSATRATRVGIRRASERRASIELMRSRFTVAPRGARRRAQQFRFVCRLARTVPVWLLSYPRRLDMLPQVVASVLAHASRRGARH